MSAAGADSAQTTASGRVLAMSSTASSRVAQIRTGIPIDSVAARQAFVTVPSGSKMRMLGGVATKGVLNTAGIIARATAACAALLAVSCRPTVGDPAPTPLEVFVAEPAPAPPPPEEVEPPDPAEPAPIEWETTEREALERARRDGAPMLIFVFAEWSAAAQEVDRRVFGDPKVIRLAHQLVMLRVDVTSDDADASLLAERYAAGQLPTIIVTGDLALEPIARIVGPTEPEDVAEAMARALR